MRWTRALGFTLALAVAAPSVLAQDRPQAHMQAMSAAFGTLRGQIGDAAKVQDNLKLLQEFEVATIAAKNTVPPTITALPEAERPAKMTAYKQEMVKLLKAVLDVEDALLAGDSAKAGTAFAALAPIQREGHTAFRGRGGGGGAGRRGGAGGGAPGGAAPGAGAPPAAGQ